MPESLFFGGRVKKLLSSLVEGPRGEGFKTIFLLR
ncbi:hypothetical protein LINPERHAP2_LOCUS15947 [Linum perenne]